MSKDLGKGDAQPPPSKRVRNSLGERGLFPAPVPAMDDRLLQALRDSRQLAFHRRSPGRRVNVVLDAKGLASCLATSTVAAARHSLWYKRYYDCNDDEGFGVKEFNDMMQYLQQECARIYGGLIYRRLWEVQHRGSKETAPQGWAPPHVSKYTQVPNFVAEAIGSIGSYLALQTEEDTTYVPALSEDDIQCQCCPPGELQPGRGYPGMLCLLGDAGIACKSVNESSWEDTRGSAWWLLRGRGLGRRQGVAAVPFQVVATLPPVNFTEADVVCFAVATGLGQESMVESVATPPLAADYGTLLHDMQEFQVSRIVEACFRHVAGEQLSRGF